VLVIAAVDVAVSETVSAASAGTSDGINAGVRSDAVTAGGAVDARIVAVLAVMAVLAVDDSDGMAVFVAVEVIAPTQLLHRLVFSAVVHCFMEKADFSNSSPQQEHGLTIAHKGLLTPPSGRCAKLGVEGTPQYIV
jgi:hypothetical protein